MRQARIGPVFVPATAAANPPAAVSAAAQRTRSRLAALSVALILAAIGLPEAGIVPALLAFLPCAVLAALVVEKP